MELQQNERLMVDKFYRVAGGMDLDQRPEFVSCDRASETCCFRFGRQGRRPYQEDFSEESIDDAQPGTLARKMLEWRIRAAARRASAFRS